MTKTAPFDPAKYLDSETVIEAYLEEARTTGDAAFIADAIETVERARRMHKLPAAS